MSLTISEISSSTATLFCWTPATTPLAMPTDCAVQLGCLVFAHDGAQQQELVNDLLGWSQLACVDTAADLSCLRGALSQKTIDFAIIALESADERLPACLLRYPDLQVLVVVPSRKIGAVEGWLEQGANDIVSRQRPEKFRHALERIIEGCVTRTKLRMAQQKLASQHKLHKILLDTYAEALLLWQNGGVLESNACLSSLVGCKGQQAQGTDWQRWLSAQSFAELHNQLQPAMGDVVITSTFGQQFNARVECLVLDQGTAQLVRVNPTPITRPKVSDDQNDSVTGVLRREGFLQILEHWLQSSNLPRYTVVQINIDEPDALPGSDRANSTLQELLVYRVVNRLQQQFHESMLIGRTGTAALTLVSRNFRVESRNLAVRIRHCLGTVGGLIDDPTHIRVKTLTLSPSALSPNEVLLRLEQHPLVTRRANQSRNRNSMNRYEIPEPVSTFST